MVNGDEEIEEKEHLVKVILDVSDDTFGIGGERVWASPLGNDLYEIRNSPWHTCDVNWGDVVRAVVANDKEWPKFVEVVRRSQRTSSATVGNPRLAWCSSSRTTGSP